LKFSTEQQHRCLIVSCMVFIMGIWYVIPLYRDTWPSLSLNGNPGK